MFELSSRLIGIYKVQNQTRSVAIGESCPALLLRRPLGRARLTLSHSLPDNRDLSQMAVTAAA